MSKNTQKLSPLQELIAEQKLLCEEVSSAYIEVSGDDVVAVAVHTLKQDQLSESVESLKQKKILAGIFMVVNWLQMKMLLKP